MLENIWTWRICGLYHVINSDRLYDTVTDNQQQNNRTPAWHSGKYGNITVHRQSTLVSHQEKVNIICFEIVKSVADGLNSAQILLIINAQLPDTRQYS